MTTQELIDRLTEMVEEDPSRADVPVRLMTQPNYPLEYSIYGVTSKAVMTIECDGGEDDDGGDCSPEAIERRLGKDFEDFVYICEGTQIGYGSKDAWETAER